MSKIKKTFAFIIVGIIFIMFIYTMYCTISPKNKNVAESQKKIKWEELYQFEEKKPKEKASNSIINKYENNVRKIANKLENITSKDLLNYEKIIEYSYIYDKAINYSLVSNSSDVSRIVIDNDYLTRIVEKYDVTNSANDLIEFNNYLKESNIDLIYVQAPYKISKNDETVSKVYKDYSNENMDDLLNKIDGKVEYIDLRKIINDEKLDHVSMFFKTDHHWTPISGLWATNTISKYINKEKNFDLDIEKTDKNYYNITTYNDMFFGADGRYVTLANAKPEAFDLVEPKFDTKLSVKILDEGIDKTDNFKNTIINNRLINYVDFYNSDQYAAYSYGTKSLIEIHNEMNKNGKKILLIRDSFGNVVVPYMALETEYLSAIDLRSFTGSLKTYIKEYNPDMVIVMYTGNHWDGLKESTNDLWKFE